MPANKQAAAVTHLSKEGIRQHYILPGQWVFIGPETVRSSRELLSVKCCLYKIQISPRIVEWKSLVCPGIGALSELAEALRAMWRGRELRPCLALPCPWACACLSTPQPVLFLEKSVSRITGETQRKWSREEEMPQVFLTCPLYRVNNA